MFLENTISFVGCTLKNNLIKNAPLESTSSNRPKKKTFEIHQPEAKHNANSSRKKDTVQELF